MSNILLLTATSLITLFFFKNNNDAIIFGEVIDNKNTKILIHNEKLIWTSKPDTIHIINEKFSKEINLKSPAFRNIQFGKIEKQLFISPGYSLNFFFNGNTYTICGKGADENIILDSINILIDNLDYEFLFNQNRTNAIKYIDSAFNSYEKTFDHLIKIKSIDPIFIEYEEIALKYLKAKIKLDYGIKTKIKDVEYYSFIKESDLENEKYLDIPAYFRFLNSYMDFKTLELIEKSNTNSDFSTKKFMEAFFQSADKLKNKNVSNYVVYKRSAEILMLLGIKNFDLYCDYFKNHNTDSIYSLEINREYERKLIFSPGKLAPTFTLEDINGNKISLEDFEGKYIYIDFWATWCRPCMEELPHFIKLQSDYKNKNIVFVSISIDTNKDSWKKIVLKNKLENINLHSIKGFDSKIVKDYHIMSIPHFVLIDYEGKIIEISAPNPSSKKIREQLDNIL